VTPHRTSPVAPTDIGLLSQATLAQRSKSFRLASWFLPPRVRRDAAIVYAFCRRVDDAADDARSPEQGRHLLDEIRDMLLDRRPPDALVTAYREVALRRGFGLKPAWDLLAGVEGDLGQVRFEDDAALLTYCYRVAGTVGLMMCGVLGVMQPAAQARAVQLGIAMQLTNVCRDLREDALLGRVYLPRKRLASAGLPSRDMEPAALLSLDDAQRGCVRQATLELLGAADCVYALAAGGYPYIPARPRLAILVAARLYRGIGRRLARAGGDALRGRTVVPPWEKALLIASAAATWLWGALLPQRRALLLDSRDSSSAPLHRVSIPVQPGNP
jgi:15-cis-phytoene synthase